MAVRKFNKSYGSIAFDDDIILAVSEKTGFTPQQVSHVFGAVFIDIKKKAKNPETHSIRLPHIGVFLFKSEYARHRLRAFDKYASENPVSNKKKERMRILRKQIENFDRRFEEKTKGVPTASPHKYKGLLNRFMFRKYMKLEEFENTINQHIKPV